MESTHYAVGHQGALDETRQHVGGVVLVVGHPGQASVKGHHDERELGERAQQPGAVPGEAGLKVKLRQRGRVCQAFSRSMEDTPAGRGK